VSAPAAPADWMRLFRIARGLIQQVNSEKTIIDHWTFGGGTAMMLQIDHRESRDVDIFLPDPQLLQFLDPQKRDFQFEIKPDGYRGDGARSLRFAFNNLGEIDFIAARALTPSSTTQTDIDGQPVLLETVAEIIIKKIYHRDSSIQPRDIFDIAAAAEQDADMLINELRNYRTHVSKTLSTLDKLNPQFVHDAIAQLPIRKAYQALSKRAFQRSREILLAV
jgi:hypothetical protein